MSNIDLTTGIKVIGQIPLDPKKYAKTLAELKTLGDSNAKAFYYYSGLIIYCAENSKSYEWREEIELGEIEGLLPNSFTYPNGSIADGIDYSNKVYNLFLKNYAKDGIDGIDGVDGQDGKDGIAVNSGKLHTWLKWADDVNGLNMSDSPTGKLYQGIAINKVNAESQDPNSSNPEYYFWTEVGSTVSYIGADGKTYYLWIKYSNNADGSDMQDESGELNYIGISYDHTSPIEGNDPLDYEWSLILEDIIKQPQIYYYWIRFAEDINGLNMSDSPIDKLFMGIAIDKLVPEKSNDPLDYVWNPITGKQGYIGPDGKTYWVWVKWAKTQTPSEIEISDNPEGMMFMGIAVNKETDVESLDYRDYTWKKINSSSLNIIQNNFIRTIEIPSSELDSYDNEGFAAWIVQNGIIVAEDEIVVLTVYEDVPDVFQLDPNIPLTLAVSDILQTQVTLTWDANGDTAITNYTVFYKRTKGGESFVKDAAALLTTDLTGLVDGREYEAYVVGSDSLGNIKQSNTVTFNTTQIYIPSTPLINASDVTDTTLTLNYSVEPSFQVDRFELYQVGVGLIYNGSLSSFNVTGLTQNTLYQFYVIAYSGATASNQSNTLDVTTLLTINPPLAAPVIKILYEGYYDITLGISSPDFGRIDGYIVERALINTENWVAISFAPNDIFIVNALIPGTTYKFRARSTDVNETISPYSNEVIGTTSDEKIKISLNSATPTAVDIAGGYKQGIKIWDGKPFSNVSIAISLYGTRIGQTTALLLESKDSGIVINHPVTYLKTWLTIGVVLDENGMFEDLFKVTGSTPVDVTVTSHFVYSPVPYDLLYQSSDTIKFTV